MPITNLFQPVLTIDEYGDLPGLSEELRSSWFNVRAIHEKAARYYSGDIFSSRVEEEIGQDDAPLLYPIGINLIKLVVNSLTDAAFGEWDDQRSVVLWSPRSDEPSNEDREAANFMTQVMEDSNSGSMLWELEFDRNLFGAGVLRVDFTLDRESRVQWKHIPIDSFYPVFDPQDPDKLLECWYVTMLLPEQVKDIYGLDVENSVRRVEHWTRSSYETTLDEKVISAYSGVNPWGVIPFIYIPRVRTLDWWGEPLADSIFDTQDELNMRLADIGEALNYHSHPIMYGVNLPKDFDAANYPIGANSMWDLGRSRAGGDNPQVGLLEARQATSPQAFEYIKFLYDWSRTSSSAPPIAFGEDEGGGQRSGITLEIRLWPLLKAIRRSRAYLTAGLLQAMQVTGKILAQKKFKNVPAGTVELLVKRQVIPSYNPVLPRDQTAIVDEVVKLMSTSPPAISLESAQVALGRGVSEVARIEQMLEEIQSWPGVQKGGFSDEENSVPDGRTPPVPGQSSDSSGDEADGGVQPD